jgi:hypothetical protein
MKKSQALIVALLLGGLALPVHAHDGDDGQRANEGNQSADNTAGRATNTQNYQGDQGQSKPAPDFSKLDVGGTNAVQTLQIYGTIH